MSKGKIDKSKWFHKLHQLQKRLNRAELNEGHSDHKSETRKGQLKRILERVMGNKKTMRYE
jgi:hypothetical protein